DQHRRIGLVLDVSRQGKRGRMRGEIPQRTVKLRRELIIAQASVLGAGRDLPIDAGRQVQGEERSRIAPWGQSENQLDLVRLGLALWTVEGVLGGNLPLVVCRLRVLQDAIIDL